MLPSIKLILHSFIFRVGNWLRRSKFKSKPRVDLILWQSKARRYIQARKDIRSKQL